jgi:transcriptional regulator GlxA family with amidase domain
VGYRTRVDAAAAARIDRVISHVERNYGDAQLSLEGAARVASFSPGAFSRFFAQVAGRPFNRYVNEVRVSHACRLLTETEMPVIEVAFACGYGTLSNFHSRFREAKQTTPLKYRRLYRPMPPV